ncbi:MAG: DUF559 domain-containing protein [Specibacter sp.]
MENLQPLPVWLRGRSFTLQESDACGISRRCIDKSDLVAPSRGIRVPWDVPQELPDRIRPVMMLTPDAVVSHATAALLWGMPLPPSLKGSFEIHVSRDGRSRAARRIGVTGHHTLFKADDVTWLNGLAITSPLRTWLDLAAVLNLDDLVAAGDYLVCEHDRIFGPRRVALVKLAVIQEAVKHEFHRRGIVKAREAAGLIRVGVDSAPETFLRLNLERAGLPELDLNYVVKDADGCDASWPDLALPEWKVSIEYDGEHHRTEKQQGVDDARDELMARLGWKQLRITKDMLDDDGDKAVVSMVLAALREQGWTRNSTGR